MMKSLLALLFFFLSCTLWAEEKAWPKHLKNRTSLPKVVAHKSEVAPFVYESRTFRYISDEKLDINKVRGFAKSAESVPAVVSRLPLSLLHMPKTTDGKKPAIYIFSKLENFERAGGGAQAAGYYSGKQKSVYLRADQFINLERGRSVNYNLLVHELAHLCNDGILGYVPAWFSEGNAEYLSAAFIPKGSYQFGSITDRIKIHIGRHLRGKKRIRVPRLNTLLHLSSSDWRERTNSAEPEEFYHLYAISLILVHHFYHQQEAGRAMSEKYIQSCLQRKRSSDPYPHIISDAEAQSLEKKLTDYWKTKGIIIQFE